MGNVLIFFLWILIPLFTSWTTNAAVLRVHLLQEEQIMKKLKGSFVGLVVHAAVDGLAMGLTHKIPSSYPLHPSCVAQFQLWDVNLRLGISSASHDMKVDVFYICIWDNGSTRKALSYLTNAHFIIDSLFPPVFSISCLKVGFVVFMAVLMHKVVHKWAKYVWALTRPSVHSITFHLISTTTHLEGPSSVRRCFLFSSGGPI